MKKIFGLLICSILTIFSYAQEVSVLLHTPGNASQGQEFEISITVNKADVTGFARLQLDMPTGFTVKAGQTQGATFSFKDNKIRFLWMSLPADRTLKVSCMASADNTVSGGVNIEGSFSYVLNNETQRYNIPIQVIQFEGGTTLAYDDTAKEEAERLEKERQERLAKEKEEHDRLAREKAEKEAKEEAERLAQLYADTNDGEDNKDDVIIDTYEKKDDVVVDTYEKKDDVVVDTYEKKEDIKIEDKPDPVKVEEVKPATTGTYTPPVYKEEPKTTYTPPTYTDAKSKTGVEYKVQIGAFKTSPAQGYFKKLESNINEHKIIKSNDNDGFVRYFIGSFDTFNSVNNFHQRILQLGYSSFIVAHKDGRKITIKEAKEITRN